MTSENIHATGLVYDGRGLLLRGASGSGKSLLALLLLDDAALRGLSASLVGDDRLDIELRDGRVLMRGPAAISGRIELRGRGILARPVIGEARIDLVVDLIPRLERMPEEEAFATSLQGVALPCCPVPVVEEVGTQHQLLLIREAVSMLSTANASPRQKST